MVSDIEFYCSYPVCMALKKDGYDRWCDSSYTYATRYKGEDIDFETELDLKAEGKAKEIKRIPGEEICIHPARNSEIDSYGLKKDCGRVTQACAMEWLRAKHMVHIEVTTLDGGDGYDRCWISKAIDFSDKYKGKIIIPAIFGTSYEEVVEKMLMKYYKVKPRKPKQDA